MEEVAETTGRLQLGHVGVQVHAIDAADFQRHVLADNGVDVGRHRDLLGRKSDDSTPVGARRVSHRAQHRFSQTAAQRPRSEGSPEAEGAEASDLHHTVNGAEIFLGGLRRSFAACPWYKWRFHAHGINSSSERRTCGGQELCPRSTAMASTTRLHNVLSTAPRVT
jgi:hypothetical protein